MSITGQDSVKAKLAKMKAGLTSNEVIQEAGKQWLEEDVLPLARQLVPKRTGNLERSIEGEVVGSEIHVRATAPYAEEVEFGGNSEAQPYLYPAIEQTKAALGRKIKQSMKRRST